MDKKNFSFKVYPLNRDISKTWFIKFKDDQGRTQKVYTGLNSLPTVEQRMQQVKRIVDSIQLKHPKQKAADIIFHIDKLLQEKSLRLAKKSYQTYQSIIKNFSAWYRLQQSQKSIVAPEDYINELYKKNLANNSIRKERVVLYGFFHILRKKKLIAENPFEDIRIKKIRGKSKLPFHPSQVATLKIKILEADPQLWDAIQFLYYTFMRPGEVRLLQISDILFDEKLIIMRDEVTKDDDNYFKKIPEPMFPLIERYKIYPPNYYLFSVNGSPGLKPLCINALNERHRKFMQALNFNNRYSLYSWVHTGIKQAVLAGIPIKQLQLQKGHSDLRMFDEYVKDLVITECEQLQHNFPSL